MIDMEGLDTTDPGNKILLLKKRMLKLDELYREHAKLQQDNEALIKGYKLIEDKEKETAKRLQKYVKGCGRLLKENELQRKEIDKLKQTVEEKTSSTEMLKLENERLEGVLKMFQEQRKHLHEDINCEYKSDRTSLIKLCYDVFKYRLRTEKMSSMYKTFQKNYKKDLETFKLKEFKIEKARKGRNIKPENFDSDLDDCLDDFLDEVKPLDSVESGYHENDSVIGSIHSKSDSKLDQEFEIREGISLNETSNERWLDGSVEGNDFIPVPPMDNIMDTNVASIHSLPDIAEEKTAVIEIPKTPTNTTSLSKFSFSPQMSPAKELLLQEINLEQQNLPTISSPNANYFSLYISPLKEKLISSPEAIEKTSTSENKATSQDNLLASKSLSFSPDSSPVKGVTTISNNLKTYVRKKIKEVNKVSEEFSELEILGKQIEKNIMEEQEVKVMEKQAEVEEKQPSEEDKPMELGEVQVETELKSLEEDEEVNEKRTLEEDETIQLEEEQVEIQVQAQEVQAEEEEKQMEKENEPVVLEESRTEIALETQEKQAEVVEMQKKEVAKPMATKDERVEMIVKQVKEVKAAKPEVMKKKQQEEEISDDELAKIFNEMKMPALLSPLTITPEVLNHENKKMKNKKKNKKAKKKKQAKTKVEDEKEWLDALYAVLSLKKKDKTAKAILDVLKKTREDEKVKKKKVKKKKCSWAVEELKEEKSSGDEKNGGSSFNKKNYVRLTNVPEEDLKISEEVETSEVSNNVLAEISTQTEVERQEKNSTENCLKEFLPSEKPKILLSEICTQTEVCRLPELPENCLQEFLQTEQPVVIENSSDENYCEMVLDLSIKTSKNIFSGAFERSEELFSENKEIIRVEKANERHEVENKNELDLSQKNDSEKIPEYNFENLSQTALNLSQSPVSPLKSFSEGISDNDYLDEFLQDALETCLTETPASPPDLEKGLLNTSTNFSENEDVKDSEEPQKCLTESPESPETEDKGLLEFLPEAEDKDFVETVPEGKLRNYHLFSDNSCSDSSEENRLRIASDELSEKSSPSNSIHKKVKLTSPKRVCNYQLRSSSLSPKTPPEPPFPQIKFIDTSPFHTYDLAFRNYRLNDTCDKSDSSDSGLPDKNSPEHSPITRNSRQKFKKRRKRRLFSNALVSSSVSESENEDLPLSALKKQNETDAADKSVDTTQQDEVLILEEREEYKSPERISENKGFSSSVEEEEKILKEVPKTSDSDLSDTQEDRPILRETRQRHRKKRKRRRIEDGSDSSSEAEAADPKKICLSELIQEREDKAAKALLLHQSSQLESSEPQTQTTETLEDPEGESPVEETRDYISTVEEEIQDNRPKRTLAEIRESVLRATRDSNISENIKRRSTRSHKRSGEGSNILGNQVEVCGSCLGRCFHKCKRKLKVTNDAHIRLLRNMTHKETPAPPNELQIDIPPEVAASSGSDSEKKKQKNQEEKQEINSEKDKAFELDSILTAMTKQKEDFKPPPKKVAILMPVFVQGQGAPSMQVMQTRGMQASRISMPEVEQSGISAAGMQPHGIPMPFVQLPETSMAGASGVKIDWKSICDNMNIENFNLIPDGNVNMNEKEPATQEKTRCKLNLKGKRLDNFVKKKLEDFVNSNMETNEQAKKNTEQCLSYLLNVPEDVIVKETVELILENVDEDIIVFEKPVPPLTKTQQRLLVILSLLQKTSDEFQTLIPSILKLINQKLFPEKFFWPDDSVESASRFFAALCKHENNFQAIWKFCFNALTEMHQRFSIVIHTVLLVWPDILHEAELIKSNLLTTTFVTLILQTPKSEGRVKELKAQQQKLLALKEMLRLFYHFETNNTLDRYLKDLMNELLKGTEKSEESLNLFVKCKTFEWLSTYFVPKILEYVNYWAEKKIENDIGIKFLNLLKLMGNKVPVSKNLNAKFSKLITSLMEILSSGKMSHSEEEKIVEVLISFPMYVKVGDVLARWNTKSDISQNLQEKISKAVKDAQKPAIFKKPQKPKPKIDKTVHSVKELNKTKKKRKKGGKKHKKKKSGDSENGNK